MEFDPARAIADLETGIQAAGALFVSYFFSLIGAIVLLVVGYTVAGFIQRWIRAGLGRIQGFDPTLSHFFARIARYIVLILVLVMVLGQFGVQTASIIAAIGAVGLAVGLALQGTLQNIAAGIMLLVLRPFRIGEYIEVGTVAGTVEEIGLFATTLRAIDGLYVFAPNSTLWNQPAMNYSRNPTRRSDVTVGIDYKDDIAQAERALLQLAQDDARVLGDPEPTVFVAALGDSSVSLTLRYWTARTDYLTTMLDLTKAAKLAFDREGITIPFPQQVITYQETPPKSPAQQADDDQDRAGRVT